MNSGTCYPITDTMYISFTTRLTRRFEYAIGLINGPNFEAMRIPLFFVDKSSKFEVQNEENRHTDFILERRSLQGYTNYCYLVLPVSERFAGVRFMISDAEEIENFAEADAEKQAPFNKKTTTRYHKVMAMFGSAYLHAVDSKSGDAAGAWRLWCHTMQGVLFHYPPADERTQISRIDICVDHWGYDWVLQDIDLFCTRSLTKGAFKKKKKGSDSKGKDASEAKEKKQRVLNLDLDTWVFVSRSYTLYIGRRGAKSRFLRVYNKLIELADTDKTGAKTELIAGRWRHFGWTEKKGAVWRAEVEHGREWLQDHGLCTVADLEGCERELWLDYVSKNTHVKKTRTRLKRCPPSEIWKKISAAHEGLAAGVWEYETRQRGNGDLDHLVKMAAGLVDNMQKQMRCTVPSSLGGIDHGLDVEARRSLVLDLIMRQLAERDSEAFDDIQAILDAASA